MWKQRGQKGQGHEGTRESLHNWCHQERVFGARNSWKNSKDQKNCNLSRCRIAGYMGVSFISFIRVWKVILKTGGLLGKTCNIRMSAICRHQNETSNLISMLRYKVKSTDPLYIVKNY